MSFVPTLFKFGLWDGFLDMTGVPILEGVGQ
jgi:hypothetical protein